MEFDNSNHSSVTNVMDVESGLNEHDAQFTQNLGFLRRGVLNEQEFVKANNMARD